jgi:hypothetical protein
MGWPDNSAGQLGMVELTPSIQDFATESMNQKVSFP